MVSLVAKCVTILLKNNNKCEQHIYILYVKILSRKGLPFEKRMQNCHIQTQSRDYYWPEFTEFPMNHAIPTNSRKPQSNQVNRGASGRKPVRNQKTFAAITAKVPSVPESGLARPCHHQ